MAKKGGSKQKKMEARVDFTPMVDMIMLLVTFFMLCTTLIKPTTVDISMPSDKEDLKEENQSQIAASKAVTILIDENDALYFYTGKPEDAKLVATAYGKDGIRAELMKLNAVTQNKVAALKKEFALKRSANPMQDAKNQAEFKKRMNELKNSDDSPNVIIRATEKATYKNLIDILDEMQICSIGKYVIDKVHDFDKEMLEAYKANPAQ